MLQSDDGDRWPIWDQEYEVDEDLKDQGSGVGENRPKRRSTEHKVTDKHISTRTKGRPKEDVSSKQEALALSTMGTELVAAIIIGLILGWGLSWLLGGALWPIVLGVLIGTAAGFLNVYRAIVELNQKEEQQRRDSSK